MDTKTADMTAAQRANLETIARSEFEARQGASHAWEGNRHERRADAARSRKEAVTRAASPVIVGTNVNPFTTPIIQG